MLEAAAAHLPPLLCPFHALRTIHSATGYSKVNLSNVYRLGSLLVDLVLEVVLVGSLVDLVSAGGCGNPFGAFHYTLSFIHFFPFVHTGSNNN